MQKTRAPYPMEFHRQIIELPQAGWHPAELSREFGRSSRTIINGVAQAARDAGRPLPGKDGLNDAECEEVSRLRRENCQLKMERDILTKTTAWFARKSNVGSSNSQWRSKPTLLYAQCAASCVFLPAAITSGALGRRVCEAWPTRCRPNASGRLTAHRMRPRTASSSRRIARTGALGYATRIARLMRAAGWRGLSRRRGCTDSARRYPDGSPTPDLVKRKCVADGPSQLRAADMTYITTSLGFIYLATVLNVWDLRVVGWSIGEHMRVELVLSAPDIALGSRKPKSLIHQRDQWSQHALLVFGKRCREMGMRLLTGTVGDAYDNTMTESSFASVECELIGRKNFLFKTEARLAVITRMECWYDPRLRHSAQADFSPMNCEEKHCAVEPHHDKRGFPTGQLAPAWMERRRPRR